MSAATRRFEYRRPLLGRFLFVVVVAVGLGVVAHLLGLNPLAAAFDVAHLLMSGLAPWWAFGVSMLVALVAVGAVAADRRARSVRGGSPARPAVLWAAGCVALLCVAAGTVVSARAANRWGHDVAHVQVNKVLETVPGPAPSYRPRVPRSPVASQLADSFGSGHPFKVPAESVWRFEVDGKVETCGLKMAYPWRLPSGVVGVACMDDSGAVVAEEFDGPLFWGDQRPLGDVVNDVFPRGRYHTGDLYGYIDRTGPHLVVPVTAMTGGARWHTGWVGALVFDADGSHRKVVDPAGLPGPVAGRSTAGQVLAALNHRGGLLAVDDPRFAYDVSDMWQVENVLLERVDGSGVRFVSLLTPLGPSETVTAVLEVDPASVVDGWPSATLYELVGDAARMSVAEAVAVADERYKGAYEGALERLWFGEPSRLAAPGASGEIDVVFSRAGVGRVSVDTATLATCLFAPDGEQLRCDSGPVPAGELGPLARRFAPGVPPADTPGAPSGADLAALSDEELAALLRDGADELEARRDTPPAG